MFYSLRMCAYSPNKRRTIIFLQKTENIESERLRENYFPTEDGENIVCEREIYLNFWHRMWIMTHNFFSLFFFFFYSSFAKQASCYVLVWNLRHRFESRLYHCHDSWHKQTKFTRCYWMSICVSIHDYTLDKHSWLIRSPILCPIWDSRFIFGFLHRVTVSVSFNIIKSVLNSICFDS